MAHSRHAWQTVRALLSLAEVAGTYPTSKNGGIACFHGIAGLVERQLHSLAGTAGPAHAASRGTRQRLSQGRPLVGLQTLPSLVSPDLSDLGGQHGHYVGLIAGCSCPAAPLQQLRAFRTTGRLALSAFDKQSSQALPCGYLTYYRL